MAGETQSAGFPIVVGGDDPRDPSITEDSEVIFVAWTDQASNDVQGRLYEETFGDDGTTLVVKALGPLRTLNSNVDGFQGNHDIAQLLNGDIVGVWNSSSAALGDSASGNAAGKILTQSILQSDADIGGDLTSSVTEDVSVDVNGDLVASGQLAIVDPDAGESFFKAETIEGPHGSLTITADGAWTVSYTHLTLPTNREV